MRADTVHTMKNYSYAYGPASGFCSGETLFKIFGVDAAWLNMNVHGGKIGSGEKDGIEFRIVEA